LGPIIIELGRVDQIIDSSHQGLKHSLEGAEDVAESPEGELCLGDSDKEWKEEKEAFGDLHVETVRDTLTDNR
jgi:hypothetical protein